MTYSKQYQAIRNAQIELGFSTSTKTQLGRKIGASSAENRGASGDSVDKNGHWQVNSRAGAYTNNVIPWECVRALAGFPPASQVYHLKRAVLEPPDALMSRIFPQLEQSFKQVKDSVAGTRKSELAGESFLALMKYMRVVILQDAAVLMGDENYKDHAVFQHNIFQSEAFETYANQVRDRIATDGDPQTVELTKAFPVIGSNLAQLAQQSVATSQSLASIAQAVASLNSNIEQQMGAMRMESLKQLSTMFTKIGSELSAVLSGAMQMSAQNGDEVGHVIAVVDAPTAANVEVDTVSTCFSPANFRMNRSIVDVCAAWKEWKHGGLNADNVFVSSIESLELLPGKKWRGALSTTEGKFFSRRKPLFDAIQLIMDREHMSEQNAVKLFDEFMARHESWDNVTPFASYFRAADEQ